MRTTCSSACVLNLRWLRSMISRAWVLPREVSKVQESTSWLGLKDFKLLALEAAMPMKIPTIRALVPQATISQVYRADHLLRSTECYKVRKAVTLLKKDNRTLIRCMNYCFRNRDRSHTIDTRGSPQAASQSMLPAKDCRLLQEVSDQVPLSQLQLWKRDPTWMPSPSTKTPQLNIHWSLHQWNPRW